MLFKPFPLIAYFLFSVGVINQLLAFIVLWHSKRRQDHLFFSLFSFCLGLWCYFIGLLALGASPSLSVFATRGAFASCAPLPFFLLLFSYSFPHGDLPLKRHWILLLAVPLLIVLAFIPSKLILDPVSTQTGTLLQLGPLNFLYSIYFILFPWAGIIFYRRYKSSTKTDKIKFKYFFFGILLASIIGIFFNLIMVSIFKSPSFVYFGPLGTIFISAFSTYAILKYRLMDISLIVKKTTAYSLITTVITFTYVLVVLLFESAFRHIYGSYSFLASIPAALIIAVTFIPLRASMQKVTDKVFFHRTIEYQKIIKEVTRLIVSVTDLKTLFRLVDRTIVRAMCVKNAAVLVLEEKENLFLVEKTNGLPDEALNLTFAPDSPLATYLTIKKDAVVLDELEALLASTTTSVKEKETLKKVRHDLVRLDAAVAFPSFAKDKIVGILSMGEKLSGEPYSPEDLELIYTMASEAGIAIENSKLYRDITQTRDYLNSLVEGSNDAILTMDLRGKVLSWNKGAEKIFGYSLAETMGKIPPIFSKEEIKQFIEDIISGKNIQTIEVRKKNKNGKEIPLLFTLSPIRDPLGQIIDISAILKDVTELKKVDQLKHEFLSVISHELRTPLTPIKGYLSLFLNGQLGPLSPEQGEAIKTISNQSNHLLDLIDSVIDISRIEAGKSLILKKEPLFLEDIVKECLEHSVHGLKLKGINIKTNFISVRSALMADKNKLARVIDSFLNNAQKFTPAKGEITIKVEKTDHQINVIITDSGVGLAKDQLHKIFERFYQVDSSYTRNSGGIGMGLTVARKIIKSHNGKIWAESEGLGKGSRFCFTLPLI